MQTAERGQLLALKCEMPQCYHHKGRGALDPVTTPRTEWRAADQRRRAREHRVVVAEQREQAAQDRLAAAAARNRRASAPARSPTARRLV